MRKYLSSLGVVPLLSLVFVSSAIAGAVTTKDLAGKKICWTNSVVGATVSTYGPGNKYTNPVDGTGTWAITAVGVEIRASTYSYVADVQKLPDGTFTAYTRVPTNTNPSSVRGTDVKSTGKYC